MTTSEKLTYIKSHHATMLSCDYCDLTLGVTCPKKPWSKWTNEEINLAYYILCGKNDEVKTNDDEIEFVKAGDSVEHPIHYTQNGIECIEAIKASMTADGFMDYCKGNVLKYIWRWRDKGGVEDLEKARVYLGWMIDEAYKEGEN